MSFKEALGQKFLRAAKSWERVAPEAGLHHALTSIHTYLTGTDASGVETALRAEWDNTLNDFLGRAGNDTSILGQFERERIHGYMMNEAQKFIDQGLSRTEAQKKVIGLDSILTEDSADGHSRHLSWIERSSRRETAQRPFTPFEPFRS